MAFKIIMTVEYPGVPPDEKVITDVGAEFVKIPCHSEDEIIAAAHDADAIITIVAAQSFPRRVIEGLEKCRIIASVGIGYDGVDLAAASERGILVTNVPDYCLEEVSDHAMALLLACARKLFKLDRATREGKWDSAQKPYIRSNIWPPMFRLRGQTVGLVGFGQIPRTLTPKAKGFGMRVIAYDPYVPQKLADDLGVELVGLDRLLQEADYISVHTALTDETRHILSLDQFKKMKPTAYVINTARGPLVDNKGLYEALKEGYIAGAGLDVMEFEPPSLDDPIFQLDNVIVTAHSGHYSDTSVLELRKRPVEEAVRALKGELPISVVNPDVKEIFLQKWGKK